MKNRVKINFQTKTKIPNIRNHMKNRNPGAQPVTPTSLWEKNYEVMYFSAQKLDQDPKSEAEIIDFQQK